MVVLVKLLGVVIVAFAVIYLVSPVLMKKYMVFWVKGKRVYAGAGLSILFGIILLSAARQCRLSWFVALMGILALIKGIYLFVSGLKGLTSMVNWWIAKPPAVLRMVGLLELALGLLFIYSA